MNAHEKKSKEVISECLKRLRSFSLDEDHARYCINAVYPFTSKPSRRYHQFKAWIKELNKQIRIEYPPKQMNLLEGI